MALLLLSAPVHAGVAGETLPTGPVDEDFPKIKVLIVDGQNNHAHWPKTTVMMKQYLEESGKFSVDVCRTANTWKGGKLLKEYSLDDGKEYKDLPKPAADPNFSPEFSKYDVVLSNFGYNAAPWPETTKANFEKYMAEGGGFGRSACRGQLLG